MGNYLHTLDPPQSHGSVTSENALLITKDFTKESVAQLGGFGFTRVAKKGKSDGFDKVADLRGVGKVLGAMLEALEADLSEPSEDESKVEKELRELLADAHLIRKKVGEKLAPETDAKSLEGEFQVILEKEIKRFARAQSGEEEVEEKK